MYNQIKSRISFNNEFSDFFSCENGVRQGENMSSYLFSIYLNDLENFLSNTDTEGLPTISNIFEDK